MAVERKTERAGEAWRWKTKQQAGTVDPGMESAKAEAVEGERKAVASFRSQVREKRKAAACLEALIRLAEKPLVGEPGGEASSALDCEAQCRACRR